MAGDNIRATAPEGRGTLSIAQDVLVEIVCTEVRHTEGVVPPLEGMVQGMLRRGPSGLRLDVSSNEMVIHLKIGVRGGMSIPEVAAALRHRIISAMRTKTGLWVRQVNIVVDHVDFDEGAPGGS
jgi:uncharacterized alkaline shock family protein YloU